MNRKLQDLIEQITTDVNVDVEAFARVLDIEDPVVRFQALEQMSKSHRDSFVLALDSAKALTIAELREEPDENGRKPSLKAIGEKLGVSPQRVHQLTNPDSRRQRWKTPTASKQ